MVLMQGIRIEALYKMLGKTNGGSCNQVVDPKTNEISSWSSTRPCCGIDGWDTSAKREFMLCTIKVWLKVFLIFHLNLISLNIVFMVNKTM